MIRKNDEKKEVKMDDDGISLLMIAIIAVPVSILLWSGCSIGKDTAESDFHCDVVYKEYEKAKLDGEQKIAVAKSEALKKVEEVTALIENKNATNIALEQEVKFLESTALPENIKDDFVFTDGETKRIMEEFILWASSEHAEDYQEALEAEREAEFFKNKADERLKTIEKKTFWNKIGLSKPDDKIYRDFIDKSAIAKNNHDSIITKLQDEFFNIETEKAMAEINQIMNGAHGDDGLRSVIKRAKNHAAIIRGEAEAALKK